MPRIDKTESAVGVVRADLAADWATGDLGGIFGVGLDTTGRIVKGAGNTGVVAIVNPNPRARFQGDRADMFKLGDVVDCVGLTAGRRAYASGTTGVITTPASAPAAGSGAVPIGYTIEADHLVIQIGAAL